MNGFALVTVLIVTAIGLLLGAGALLLFRYQCQLRIDRQHDLEKIYAVRSALNYIRTTTVSKTSELGYRNSAGADRDLQVRIDPVQPVFPVTNALVKGTTNQRHFTMQYGDLSIPLSRKGEMQGFVNAPPYDLDCTYGAEGVTNVCETLYGTDNDTATQTGVFRGLVFDNRAATSQYVRCWVNIGMPDIESPQFGGWLQKGYGLRYSFFPQACDVTDVIRLWLIRDPQAVDKGNPSSCGWPPGNEEKTFEFKVTNKKHMELWECKGTVEVRRLCQLNAEEDQCYMGIQLAHDKASVFYISNVFDKDSQFYESLRGYKFSDVKTISSDWYNHFYRDSQVIGEKILAAPKIRAVFETYSMASTSIKRLLTNFRVAPAYQYEISVLQTDLPGMTNLATVAQRLGEIKQSKVTRYTILTYDTHGTDHRGYRQDELDYIRSHRK